MRTEVVHSPWKQGSQSASPELQKNSKQHKTWQLDYVGMSGLQRQRTENGVQALLRCFPATEREVPSRSTWMSQSQTEGWKHRSKLSCTEVWNTALCWILKIWRKFKNWHLGQTLHLEVTFNGAILLVDKWAGEANQLQTFIQFCQLLRGSLEQSNAPTQTREKQFWLCRVHHILPQYLLSLRPGIC